MRKLLTAILLTLTGLALAQSDRTIYTENISTEKTNQDITISPSGTGSLVFKDKGELSHSSTIMSLKPTTEGDQLILSSADSSSATASGSVTIQSGINTSSGDTGDVTVASGVATSGTRGDVNITGQDVNITSLGVIELLTNGVGQGMEFTSLAGSSKMSLATNSNRELIIEGAYRTTSGKGPQVSINAAGANSNAGSSAEGGDIVLTGGTGTTVEVFGSLVDGGDIFLEGGAGVLAAASVGSFDAFGGDITLTAGQGSSDTFDGFIYLDANDRNVQLVQTQSAFVAAESTSKSVATVGQIINSVPVLGGNNATAAMSIGSLTDFDFQIQRNGANVLQASSGSITFGDPAISEFRFTDGTRYGEIQVDSTSKFIRYGMTGQINDYSVVLTGASLEQQSTNTVFASAMVLGSPVDTTGDNPAAFDAGDVIIAGGTASSLAGNVSVNSGSVSIISQDAAINGTGAGGGGNADSGSITIQTGAAVGGGTRGTILIDAAADGTTLANAPTGSTSLAVATVGYVQGLLPSMVSVEFGGGTEDSNCTADPCTERRDVFSNVSAVNRNAAGQYSVTTSAFTQEASCTCSAVNVGTSPVSCTAKMSSSTNIDVYTDGGATDTEVNLICIGS